MAAQGHLSEPRAGSSSGRAAVKRGVVYSPFLRLDQQHNVQEAAAKVKEDQVVRRVAREQCKANQEREFFKKMASRELQRCRFCCDKVHRGGKSWVGPLVLSWCAPISLSSWRRERHRNSTSTCALGRLRAVQGTAVSWATISVAVMTVNRVRRDCITGLAIPVINLSRWLTPASCVGCDFPLNIEISLPTLLQKVAGTVRPALAPMVPPPPRPVAALARHFHA